jgi:hypothetical protein
VPLGVLDQVAHDADEPVAVGHDPGRGELGRDGRAGRRARRQHVLHELRQVDLLHPARRPGVEPGEQQQVVDEPRHAQHLVQRRRQRRLGPRGIGVDEGHLERGADGGQRAAQLVRRVGDEGPLPGPARLEPVQHAVQRLGQPAHLVLRRRHRQAPRRVGGRHRLRAAAQLLDRSQRAPDGEPHAGGRRQQQQRQAGEQRRPDEAQRVVDGRDRDRREHHRTAVGAPGHHAQGVPVGGPVTGDLHRVVRADRARHLVRGQQRHGAARAGRGRHHRALGGEDLHEHRRVPARQHAGQPALLHQARDLVHALPGPVVGGARQPGAQDRHEQQRPREQRCGHHGARQHRDPRLQPRPLPAAGPRALRWLPHRVRHRARPRR